MKRIDATTIAAGGDYGNSETTWTVKDKSGMQESWLTQPTIYHTGDYAKLTRSRQGMGSQIKGSGIKPFDLAIRYTNSDTGKIEERFLGDLAARQNEHPIPDTGDRQRYASPQALGFALAMIAAQLDPKITEFTATIVLSVPVRYWGIESLKEAIKARFKGTHKFTLMMLGEEREMIAHFRIRWIAMEGYGALIMYGDDRKPGKRGFIDAGGGTTDLILLDNMDVVTDKTDSILAGAETIGNAIARDFLNEHNVDLGYGAMHQLLRAYGSRLSRNPLPYPQISIGETSFGPEYFNPIIERKFAPMADDILRKVGAMWGTENLNGRKTYGGTIPTIYLVGGTMYHIGPMLKPHLPTAKFTDLCEVANSRGNAEAARLLMK